MAELDQPAPDTPAPAPLPPDLEQFQKGVPEDLSQHFEEPLNQLSDFFQTRALAQQNMQEAQKGIDGYNAFQDTLTGIVQQDPTALDTMVGVGKSVAEGFVADHPYLPDEQKPDVAAQLAGGLRASLTGAAVMSAVDARNYDLAHEVIDKTGDYLDSANGAIDKFSQAAFKHGGYLDNLSAMIGVRQDATTRDQLAEKAMAAKQRPELSGAQLLDYANTLVDPRGRPVVPKDFNDRVTRDRIVNPADTLTAQLLAQQAAHGKDLDTSPVGNIMAALADPAKLTPGDILGKANLDKETGGLKLQDATILAKMAQSPDDTARYTQVLAIARSGLLGDDGELHGVNANRVNDLAHHLLVNYRDQGSVAFDAIKANPLLRGGLGQTFGERATAEAKAQFTLDQIFGRQHAAAQRVEQARQFQIQERQINATASHEREVAQLDERRAVARQSQQAAADARAERARVREEQIQQRAEEVAQRASAARRGGGGGGGGGGGRGRAPQTPIEEFRRGYALTRKL